MRDQSVMKYETRHTPRYHGLYMLSFVAKSLPGRSFPWHHNTAGGRVISIAYAQ